MVEKIPPGVTVSNITVLPTGQVTGGPNLAAGSVNIALGSGVTEVTFTNKRTGYLEICKNSAEGVKGDFSFTVNPGSLGPIVVAAGTCSPAIEVDAGEVLISEQQIDGYVMADCYTFPASRQGACNLEDLTSIVTVAPGDVSTQTVVFITNRRRK
ncbi:MAG: hypothetical protein GXP03_10715 [Alphaproteobacteria bacterium]|nr:hypothetical protein [Alphaproteobacteria bacterium]